MSSSTAARKAQAETAFAREKVADPNNNFWPCKGDNEALRKWRHGNGRVFDKNATVLRVMFELEGLMVMEGYAFAGTGVLAAALGVSVRAVQKAILLLEQRGAILRRGRRTYPLATNVEAVPRKRRQPQPKNAYDRRFEDAHDGCDRAPDSGTRKRLSQARKAPDSGAYTLPTPQDTQIVTQPSQAPTEQVSSARGLAFGTAAGVATVTAISQSPAQDVGTPDYDYSEWKALAPPIRRTSEHDRLTDEEAAFIAELPLRLPGHDDIRLLGDGTSALFRYQRRVEESWRQEINADWQADEFPMRALPPNSPFWVPWHADKPGMKAKGYRVEKTAAGYQFCRRRRAAA